MGKLKFAYAEIEYDGSGESIIREIGQIFTRAMTEPATGHTDPLNAMNVLNGRMAASGLPAPVSDSPSPAKPRRTYSRRPKAASREEEPVGGPQRRQSRPAAPPDDGEPPTKLSDRIAAAIDQRGPLTVTRLAQLLNASETGIRKSIGHSRGRFVMDDEERFSIA